MTDQTQEFFQLRRRPFDKDLPDEALWLDPDRTDAIDRLVDAVRARQHALVLGEPGVGKNCVVRGLRARLSPVHFRLTYVAHVSLGKRDFYKQVCLALGVECKLMPATLYAAIQANLAALAKERVHPVLVLDEAHLMPDSSLSTLHVLANCPIPPNSPSPIPPRSPGSTRETPRDCVSHGGPDRIVTRLRSHQNGISSSTSTSSMSSAKCSHQRSTGTSAMASAISSPWTYQIASMA